MALKQSKALICAVSITIRLRNAQLSENISAPISHSVFPLLTQSWGLFFLPLCAKKWFILFFNSLINGLVDLMFLEIPNVYFKLFI